MAYIKFRVTGMTPLLLNNPVIKMAPRSGGIGIKRIPTPEEEAEAGTYRLADGQLYVQSVALRASLIDGGKGRRIGKNSAPKLIQSALFVVGETCPLWYPETKEPIHTYEIDIRRAVPKGQGAVLRARPRIGQWETEVEFEYDNELLPIQAIYQSFELAGRTVGIGDYRPGCPVGKGSSFGRYRITLLTPVEEQPVAEAADTKPAGRKKTAK